MGNPVHFLLTGGNIFYASAAIDLLSEVNISGSNIKNSYKEAAKAMKQNLNEYRILRQEGESLEAFLQNRVFADAASTTCQPLHEDVAGYRRFLSRFTSCLELERVLDEKA